MNMLDSALKYAGLGWSVLPLVIDGKRPATPNGVYDATSDAEQIQRWWGDGRTYNIGIAIPAGVVVIDVDPRNGGVDTLRGVVRELGELPNTAIAETRSDGLHVWLRTDLPADQIRGRLGPGVDIKKLGGYVVAPPSKVEPGQYRWRQIHPPAQAPRRWERRLRKPAMAPVQIVTDPAEAREWLNLALLSLRTAREGNRNNTLSLAAWQLATRGCLTEDAQTELECAAGELGLGAEEISNTIASALAGAKRKKKRP